MVRKPTPAEPDLGLSVPWNKQDTVEAAAGLGRGEDVERRTFLALSGAALTAPAHQWLVHEPESLTSTLRSGSRIPAGLADRLPPMIAELRRMDDVAGGGAMLSLAQQEFSWVTNLLNQTSYDEATGRKLLVALAELGQLVGWAAYDDGQYELAQRYNLAGLRAAHSAGDRPLGAHILGYMAFQSVRQGDPIEAVTLTETALAGAGHGSPASLLALLYDRQAEALASCHETKACMTAIDKAQALVERMQPANDPAWLYWMSRGVFLYGSGTSLIKVGHAERAVPLLEEGALISGSSYPRDRLHALIRLAEALVRPGEQQDVEAAAHHGIEAVQIAENLISGRSVQRIRELEQQMEPQATLPAVRDFMERAQGLAPR